MSTTPNADWITERTRELLRPFCDVYWGSHGCMLEPGHDGPHECDCCECPTHAADHEAEGCVAKPPYYGPGTNFWGDDADTQDVS